MSRLTFLSLVIASSLAFPAYAFYTKPETSDNFLKGMAAYALGHFDEALKDFSAVLADNPGSWQAYEQEGYCYFHLNRPGEMNAAFNESLQLHPDNAELRDFLQQIGSPLNPVPSPGPTPVPVPTAIPSPAAAPFPETRPAPQAPDKWGSSSWLNLSGAFSYAALGDLNNAANLWNQVLAQDNAQGNASAANLGFQLGVEGGLALDKTDALSLQAGFETGHGFQEHLVYSSPLTESVNPQLFTFGLNYYRYFPAGDTRFFLTGGVLFGLVAADYYQDDPTETIQGPLFGNNLGFQLGAGEEWRLSPAVGFQVIGRFRYLSIPQLQNNFNVPGMGNGQAVLATDSQGDLGLALPQQIGQGGLRYAVMDYTGASLSFSFNFYLF